MLVFFLFFAPFPYPIQTNFHNLDQISQFRPNFTTLTKFHNFKGGPRGVWQKTRLFPVFVLCTLPLQQMFAFLSFCLSVAVLFKWECELPAWKSRQLERLPVSRKRNKKSRESNNSELSRFYIVLLAKLHTVRIFNCMTFWFGESLL